MADFPNTVEIETTVDVETALRYSKYQQHIGHTVSVQCSVLGTILTYCVTCGTIIEVVGREEDM